LAELLKDVPSDNEDDVRASGIVAPSARQKPTKAAAARRGRPKGSLNKPKPPSAAVAAAPSAEPSSKKAKQGA